jgi:gamma-glutamyltranspeptidase/glutathione hydrolase
MNQCFANSNSAEEIMRVPNYSPWFLVCMMLSAGQASPDEYGRAAVAVGQALLDGDNAADSPDHRWLAQWKNKNPTWRAVHLIGPRPQKLSITKRFISEALAPMGINALILEVNYGFQYRSHPELECQGLNKEQARELTEHCRQHGVRLIPLFNCLGHQSWSGSTFPLLRKYPQFDETPNVPADNEGIYCREWCPSNPEIDGVVFALLDELIEAFDADALHVGMDEVFLIGSDQCPRCKDKDVAELFAGVVNRLHAHLAREKGVEMLMWGDRLLEAERLGYGRWEASDTGSHRAIDLVPKDIIICDWHYGKREDYPSVRFFQEKGFRVLPATWKTPDAAVALIRYARQQATDKMLGILFTGWSAGGNGEYLFAALTDRQDIVDSTVEPKRLETGRQIAATVRAGMKEWTKDSPAEAARVDSIRWKASGQGGAVAAGGSGAVAAGMQLLQEGGNAADGAAATLLALAVTDYGSFAIGGEIPLLIYDADKREVKALSGAGRAPLDQAAIDWYYAHGIPARGSMKAAPVPGAVDLCVTLLKLYGTKSFEQAVAPTLAILDQKARDWHGDLAVTLRKLVEAERNSPGSRQEKLTAARDRFYKGDVADELEAWYIETDAFLRKRDLAEHITLVEDPVTTQYRGYTVHKCGPWTQGPVLCQTLRLLEGFDLNGMNHLSTNYIHTLVESLKLGFADRDEYYGDPLFAEVPLKALLSDQYTKLRRPLIDMTAASLKRRPGDPYGMKPVRNGVSQPAQQGASGRVRGQDWADVPDGPIDRAGHVRTLSMLTPPSPTLAIPIQDTTTCVVADRWGNLVAATPSCNLVGNRPGPSGVTQGNRVRSLNTTPGHPNRVQPGKRPRITLTPTIVTKDDKPVVAISVAGGDLQDQTTLNVLLNHIEFGMLPDRAVTAPRFNTSHHQNSFDPNPDREAAFVSVGGLRVNGDIPDDVRSELAERGHRVSTTSGPIAHPVMIYIDHKTDTIYAAGDPKARRHAAALD